MKNKNDFSVMDLFAGAGGFGLGFELESNSYNVICSLEIDKWAVETLNTNNFTNRKVICGDIKSYDSAEKILAVCPKIPDVIIGGPPCQGFSYAGPAKDPKDPRNSLFKYFAQWVNVLKPRIFVMENVQGLLNRKNEKGEKVIDIILNTFSSFGYYTNIWHLNAANYGVPQNRERIFIVGSLSNEKIPTPPKTHYTPADLEQDKNLSLYLEPAVTVNEAISDLPFLKAGEGDEVSKYDKDPLSHYQVQMRNNSINLSNHVSMKHTNRIVSRYEQILDGCSLTQVPDNLKVRKRNGNGELSQKEYNSNYRHLKPDMISYTIPASFYSNFVHPTQPRNITTREAARLQSFPDYYTFKGKRTQISSKLLKQLGKEDENYLSQYNQVGNAVPPLLAKAVAKQIRQYLNKSRVVESSKIEVIIS